MTWDSKPFTWETLIHHPPCYPSFSKPQLHQPSGGGFLFSSAKSLALGRVVTGLRGWTTSNKTREISTIAYQPSGWNIKVDCPKTSWILMVCWFCGDFFFGGHEEKKPFFQTFRGARVAEVVRCSWCLSPLRIQRVTTMSKQPFPESSQAPAHRACLTWQTNDVWRRRIPKSHEDYDDDLPSPVSKGQIPQCATCTCDHMQPWKITTTPVLP